MENRRQLITNGSFEAWTPRGVPARWTVPAGAAKQSHDCAHGESAVELAPDTQGRGTVLQQKLDKCGPVAGKNLHLSASAKSLDPEQLRVTLFYTVNGERRNFGRCAKGIGEWEQLRLESTFPDDADPDSLLLKIHLLPKAKYAAIVDNVRIFVSE